MIKQIFNGNPSQIKEAMQSALLVLLEGNKQAYGAGANTPPETRMLLGLLSFSLRAQNIIESGVDHGITTRMLALIGGKVTGVDNYLDNGDAQERSSKHLSPFNNIVLVEKEALSFLRGCHDNSYDFVFIDDNHNWEHVMQECMEVKRILRPGGMAAFHDTTLHNLWPMVDDIFSDWQRINLPAISPANNEDLGLGLVRKPTFYRGNKLAELIKVVRDDTYLPEELKAVFDGITQYDILSGGMWTSPFVRLLALTMALLIDAKDILETGYDAGYTTLALALSGANVVGIDDLSEYGQVDTHARKMLAEYKNVTLLNVDALQYLKDAQDCSFDLIFIDDNHGRDHVYHEAIEVRRVLRPNGIVFFHDTSVLSLSEITKEVFPDWQQVDLPAFGPQLLGIPEFDYGVKTNFGITMIRKPID